MTTQKNLPPAAGRPTGGTGLAKEIGNSDSAQNLGRTQADFPALAPRLIANGYSVIPIKPGEKRPAIAKWQEARLTAADCASYPGHGVGVLCGQGAVPIVGVDIDVLDESTSASLAAFVRARTSGEPCERIGRAPKRLFVVRVPLAGQRKRTSRVYRDSTGREHKIEVLGQGQQFVAYGTHPDTGQAYEWTDLLGGIEHVRAADLPTWGDRDTDALFAEFDQLARGKGWHLISKESGNAGAMPGCDGDLLALPSRVGMSIDEAAALVERLPNDDAPYDDWLHVGMALHSEYSGTEHEAHALETWKSWGAKSSKDDSKEYDRKWRSFGKQSGRPVTLRWLLKHCAGAPGADGFEDEPIDGDNESSNEDGINAVLLGDGTQDAIALLFRQKYRRQLLYSAAREQWFKWDGTRWALDRTNRALDFARRCARSANHNRKAAMASAAFAEGVAKFVRADSAFYVDDTESPYFDTDNYLLNCPDGTYDLKTGDQRPHSHSDAITKLCRVAPSKDGGSDFLRFVDEITQGDKELVEFLQVSLGAVLSGAVESHWLLFWYGQGRNGKNTLGDLVVYTMGSYAGNVPASLLMSTRYEAHPTEFATLAGLRLAVSSEVTDGAHWDESRLNRLTGDETFPARRMRTDFFDVRRTHKHLIYGNHRPQLRNITDALKHRVIIVPFRASFAGKGDTTLPARLRQNAGFVLHWMIEGHKKWLAFGRKLPTCKAVDDETRDYFESQSTIEAWLAERTERVDRDDRPTKELPAASALYGDYEQHKRSRGEVPASMTRWGETMKKYFVRVRSEGVRYRGVRFLDRPESPLF